MKFEEIKTDRLILRKLSQEVYDQIFGYYSKDEVMSYLGLSSEKEYLEEKVKYESGLTTHNRKILYFQLLDKTTSTIIGWCGYHTWYVDHFRAEIGYGLFDESLKGKGLMSEAMLPIIKFGFDQMSLNRIEAFIAPYNQASLKLVSKFNFKEEGLLREHYYKTENAEASAVYSLLKSEFKLKDHI
ncbi:MAG: GNAT family N-acetyltransferase [Crocinitomicaceae bacterium]